MKRIVIDEKKFCNMPRSKLNIAKSNFDSMNILFSNTIWEEEFLNLNASQMYDRFIEIYHTAIDRFTSKVQIRPGQRPTKPKWLNNDIRKLAHKSIAPSKEPDQSAE